MDLKERSFASATRCFIPHHNENLNITKAQERERSLVNRGTDRAVSSSDGEWISPRRIASDKSIFFCRSRKVATESFRSGKRGTAWECVGDRIFYAICRHRVAMMPDILRPTGAKSDFSDTLLIWVNSALRGKLRRSGPSPIALQLPFLSAPNFPQSVPPQFSVLQSRSAAAACSGFVGVGFTPNDHDNVSKPDQLPEVVPHTCAGDSGLVTFVNRHNRTQLELDQDCSSSYFCPDYRLGTKSDHWRSRA
jgi:hypothetical protein